MERRQSDESGQAAGRTVRILGARNERKCPLCERRAVCFYPARSDSDEFVSPPDPAPKTIRQPERLEGTKNIQ